MTPSNVQYKVDLFIGNSDVNYNKIIRKVEWKSIADSGFIFRAVLADNTFDILDKATLDLFENSRQYNKPLIIRFTLRWDDVGVVSRPELTTRIRTAIVTDFDSRSGQDYAAMVEFIAIDPISFHINNGDCSGGIFKGKIGGDTGVIAQVIDKYVPKTIEVYDPGKKSKKNKNVKRTIGETSESPTTHWMMRQDPKTFIMSMLDWSCSFNPHRTSWLVSIGEEEDDLSIGITESYTANLTYPNSSTGERKPLLFRYGGQLKQPVADILSWNTVHDSTLVTLNTKLVTSGISAISGRYLDRKTDWKKEQDVYVTDKNTEFKSNPFFGEDRGYAKPNDEQLGWTYIPSIPEHSGGDLGIKYSSYIDGRARQIYMDMLNMVMRIKITVRGEPRLFDSSDLGRTYVTLKWLGVKDSEAKFMDGNWLLYGWHHKLTRNWTTDVYLSRLDYNATAMPGQSGKD